MLAILTAFVMAVVGGLASVPAQADTATQQSVAKAADWIKQQWDTGNYVTSDGGGLSDFVLALSSADLHHDTIAEMVGALHDQGPAYFDVNPTTTRIDAMAKVALALDAAGVDPANFWEGRDIVAELLAWAANHREPVAGMTGRWQAWGHHLSVIALLRLDADLPEQDLAWLTDQILRNQGTHGGFGWTANPATGDPDYTGLAISALLLTAENSSGDLQARAQAALEAAIGWAQHSDNQRVDEFGNQYWATYSSANAAGILGGALSEAGQDIGSTQAYLVSQQGLTASGVAWSNTHNGTRDNLMATLQAIFGVTGKSYAHARVTAQPEPAPTVTVTVTAEPTSTPTVTETVTVEPTSTPTVTETVTTPGTLPKTLEGVCDSPTDGVSVVIDFGDKTPEGQDQVIAGCAEGEQVDGFDALANAGFAINEGADGAYPGTVCTIDRVPSGGYPECWFVGYWSYWHAEPGGLWEYSQLGVGNRTPAVGSVEGWRWVDLSDLMSPPELGPTFVDGVDVTAPVLEIQSAPPALVEGTSATVTFGVDDLGATLECRLDQTDWAECPEPSGWDASTFTYTVADLTPGDHVISIRATDVWNNASVTNLRFKQGTPEPTPTITETVTAEPTSTPTVTEIITAEPTATPTVTETVTADPTATPTVTETVTADPTATPTVTETVTADPTSTPTVTRTVTSEPSAGPVDLYTTVGTHYVNGRFWHTTCEPYSQVQRCRTEIWGSSVTLVDGSFVQTTGWVFNNLTYTAGPRSLWANNPLGNHNAPQGWTADDGRRWYTECDTAATGRGGCRSYIWATVHGNVAPEGEAVRFGQVSGWQFNNMVRFQ
ncbi:hypothetical protein GCM10028820_24840 [Tessaracoccus terricola]